MNSSRQFRTIYSGKAAIHPAIASKMMLQMAEKNESETKKKDIQYSLSIRELEVFELLTKGMSNKDIATQLIYLGSNGQSSHFFDTEKTERYRPGAGGHNGASPGTVQIT
jgi:hypothetical protein